MDADANPYVPGFGVIPPALAGREPEFADVEAALRRVRSGIYEQPRLLSGDRGMGKTAVLADSWARLPSAHGRSTSRRSAAATPWWRCCAPSTSRSSSMIAGSGSTPACGERSPCWPASRCATASWS